MSRPPSHVGCRLIYSVENNIIGSNQYPGWKKKAVFRLPSELTPEHIISQKVTSDQFADDINKTATNILWTVGILFGIKISKAACHLSSCESEPRFMGKAVIKRKLLEKYNTLYTMPVGSPSTPCLKLSPEEFQKVIPLSIIPTMNTHLASKDIFEHNNACFLVSHLQTEFLYAIRLVNKRDMIETLVGNGSSKSLHLSTFEITVDGQPMCLTRDYYRIIPK